MRLTQLFSTLIILAIVSLLPGTLFGQGVTTSSITGKITDTSGEVLIGATVIAVHTPSGTTYGTSTDVDGNYRIPGMRVGGPYKITVTYTGYSELTVDNVYLRLGEALSGNYALEETATELSTIYVTATPGVTGQTAGASTQITTEEIDAMPTLNRNLNDYLRLTPQASAFGDGITFAGMNNRFNAIYIDGAVNNDVFGLASTGTNGGQTGISPFSIDIIDQLQVVLSPYDVTLGGFAGGGINAVTKSGTNTFTGTAYYFFQNQGLAGETNKTLSDRLDIERTKLDKFSQNLYGFSVGGPIVKDKVFFFANAEFQKDQTPIPFEVESYLENGNSSIQDLENLRSFLQDNYGYDPGGFRSTSDELDGIKIFGKIDVNLNQNHRLTLRHQYTKAEQLNRNGGNSRTINFENNGYFFPSITNSSAVELNSRFGTKFSNNLILGYTNVNDDRDAIAADFPYVFINDGAGTIRFGTEEFSTANSLKQSIFTLTDNFKWYLGNHTLTIGTHNEFYDIYNLFIGQNYGTYRYSNLQDFLNNAGALEYDRAYSLVDDITGDGSAAAADFKAIQLGFYAQDEWSISRKFTLTYGIRLDLPIITSDPKEDTYFNQTALPKMQAAYDVAKNVRAGKAPDGQLMFSPRVGFNYDVTGTKSTIIRGGIGVFTSRIPFVWPGAMFNNNGLTQGRVDERDLTKPIDFIPDIDKQYTNPNFTIPSGQVDLFTQDFKYPQVLRGNLALDQQLPGGIKATLEGIYTKTLNNVLYTNINSDPAVRFTWTGADNRKVFTRTSIDPTYNAVYVGSNTSEGYTYNLSATLAKDFDFGLGAFLAYTYGDAKSINDGTSSQNSSQWRGQIHIDGRNNPVFGRSDYALGHRIVAALSYKLKWTQDGNTATTFSLFYNGQSGSAFSYVIGNGSQFASNLNNETGSTSRNRSLVYIPASASEINLVDYTSGGQTITVAQQWTNLNAFIEEDPSLKNNRGSYAEKNGATAPFTGIFDFAIRQDFGMKIGNNVHKLQLSMDVFNFANLLNPSWGVVYYVPGDFNNYFLYNFEGYEADGTTPKFTYRNDVVGKDAFDIDGTLSRWRMRLGIRYIFN